MANLELRYFPGGQTLIGVGGERLAPTLRTEQLVTASLEFAKVERAATVVEQGGADPWEHCPACALTMRTTLADGEKG